MRTLDQELLLNSIHRRTLDKLRLAMKPKVKARFDALTPDDRRRLITKKLNEDES